MQKVTMTKASEWFTNKKCPQTTHRPSVRTEQRHSLEAKDSSPFLGCHTRMCLSQTRQETKKEAAPGPSGQRVQPRGCSEQQEGGGFRGWERQERGLSGRENVTEKLGEGEDERDAFSTRKGQRRSIKNTPVHLERDWFSLPGFEFCSAMY